MTPGAIRDAGRLFILARRLAIAQAKQKAADAADASASAASKTAFALFVDLLLGAISAAIGGALAGNGRRSRSALQA